GETGALELGATLIADGDLSAHSSALAEIGASLAPAGAIQLYGCDVAQGASGQQFINDFSTFAGGVQVDAATHIVGSASFGGSWTLDAVSDTPAAPGPTGGVAPLVAPSSGNVGALAPIGGPALSGGASSTATSAANTVATPFTPAALA